MNITFICLQCMADKGNQNVCPSCGVDDSLIIQEPHALPFRAVLHGKYLIGRLLGSGGFGNTYLALDLFLQRKLAIKEYMPRELASRVRNQTEIQIYSGDATQHFEHGMEKFLDEARTLALFSQHPGIVEVRDFFYEHRTAYIAMEFVEGFTLKQYLSKMGGKLSFAETMNIMNHVMDALRAVHAAGLLHRDISPDNIYITRAGQVKLLDFGAARAALGQVSKSMSVILKPGFAPSEQYSSRGRQGPWTDVYAVAATIYYMLTGIMPPDSLDRLEEDHLLAPAKFDPQLPRALDAILLKALAVRAHDRYPTISDFQYAMKQMSAPEIAVPKVLVQPVEQPKQKNRFGFVLFMFLIGLAVMVGAYTIWSSSAPKNPGSNQGTKPPEENLDNPINHSNPRKLNWSLGDYVQFGRYLNQPILWRVVHFDDDGDPLLFSDRILTLKAFDAGGSMHVDSNRQQYGSNYYPQSNIRDWLNSADQQISWSQNPPYVEHVSDGYNAYADEPGFLYAQNFTDTERSFIKEYTHQSVLSEFDVSRKTGGDERYLFGNRGKQAGNRLSSIADAVANYDAAWYAEVSDRVFLLSTKMLKEYVYDQAKVLGENYYRAKPTASAIEQSDFTNEDIAKYGNVDYELSAQSSWMYWLNTSQSDTSDGVQYVFRDGRIRQIGASSGSNGVRPALYLSIGDARIEDGGSGTFDDPYVVGN